MANMAKKKSGRKKEGITTVKGMHDILPDEQVYWERVRNVVFDVAKFYGFGRIMTPVLEDQELFARTLGAGTDIVEKEMYAFKTQGGDAVALRPEGTAPVVRAYIEHGMHSLPQPVKLFYFGPFFRHEKPQKGRYRQFRQMGFEMIGIDEPLGDAELVQMAFAILRDLGVKNLICEVNTIGDPEDRKKYIKELKNYLRPHVRKLPADDKRRYKQNVLRILDTKEEETQEILANAPQIIDHVSEEAREHFKRFLEYLDELEIPYLLKPNLVRGLDYYNRTVFEIRTEDDVRAHGTLIAGGRYDGLVKQVGGQNTPAVGFGAGIERIIEQMRTDNARVGGTKRSVLFLVQLGDLAKKKGLGLMETFRKANLNVEESLGKHSIRSQLKIADKIGADLALIVGQKEALSDEVIIRDMETGVQETVPVRNIVKDIKRRLAKKRK